MAAPLAAHHSAVYQGAALFCPHRPRCMPTGARRWGWMPSSCRLVERVHSRLHPPGRAAGADEARAEFARLQHPAGRAEHPLRAEPAARREAPSPCRCRTRRRWPACQSSLRAAARQAAADRGLAVPVITLGRSLGRAVPHLQHPARPARGRLARLDQTAAPTTARTTTARWPRRSWPCGSARPTLMGHASYAGFKLADTMAQTPASRLGPARRRVAARRCRRWRASAVAAAAGDGRKPVSSTPSATLGLAPSGPSSVRQARYALDDAANSSPTWPLPAMVAAAFECAQAGCSACASRPRTDLAGYHPDVAVYQVDDAASGQAGRPVPAGQLRPARPKRSGAWMSTLAVAAPQCGDDGSDLAHLPIVLNNNNFARAEPGTPALLSPDDVRTLFPRVRPRPARVAERRGLRAPVGHPGAARLRRTAVAAVRALGPGTGSAAPPCPPLADRRGHSRGPARQAGGGAPLRPGL